MIKIKTSKIENMLDKKEAKSEKRYFECNLKNGGVIVLSEFEINQYREYINNVRTELVESEIKSLKIKSLSEDNIKYITKN